LFDLDSVPPPCYTPVSILYDNEKTVDEDSIGDITPWDCVNDGIKKEIIVNFTNNLRKFKIRFHRFSEMIITPAEHNDFISFVDTLMKIHH